MNSTLEQLAIEDALDAGELIEERAPTLGPRLPPYFGHEALSREIEIARQRRGLRDWIDRNCRAALARKMIATRCAAALAAEGLD